MLQASPGASAVPARGTLVFAVLSALLTVALFVEIRKNRRLRDELARDVSPSFAEGRTLATIELRNDAGEVVPIEFTDAVGTVLLFHSDACDACASTAPLWRSALVEAARPDVKVVVAQTDGQRARVDLEGLPASLVVPLPPEGWHAELPAVPATLVVDADGVLVRAWFGRLDEDSRGALVETLLRLGS